MYSSMSNLTNLTFENLSEASFVRKLSSARGTFGFLNPFYRQSDTSFVCMENDQHWSAFILHSTAFEGAQLSPRYVQRHIGLEKENGVVCDFQIYKLLQRQVSVCEINDI